MISSDCCGPNSDGVMISVWCADSAPATPVTAADTANASTAIRVTPQAGGAGGLLVLADRLVAPGPSRERVSSTR